MIKVNYDTETTLAKGYYPDDINYALIPEPYIEISEEEHQEALGKTMCVIDGVFQEYVASDSEQVAQAKTQKINQTTTARKSFQYSDIAIDGRTFANSESAQNKFFNTFLGAVSADFPIDWRLADYSWVQLSKDECLALEAAIIEKEKSSYMQETVLIEALKVCTTLDELNAINIIFE